MIEIQGTQKYTYLMIAAFIFKYENVNDKEPVTLTTAMLTRFLTSELFQRNKDQTLVIF